ncbi:hypothetical protein NUW54_g12082 [Trametes sanguinea]|uniref:Uncharacterized protein n=1 Tax=Trametes sanguinea TaxID=158606 RepID=A0ACC1N251_9APHY|nr:hypothetical protein NUW54_g12082 [Trametes sanguinea]
MVAAPWLRRLSRGTRTVAVPKQGRRGRARGPRRARWGRRHCAFGHLACLVDDEDGVWPLQTSGLRWEVVELHYWYCIDIRGTDAPGRGRPVINEIVGSSRRRSSRSARRCSTAIEAQATRAHACPSAHDRHKAEKPETTHALPLRSLFSSLAQRRRGTAAPGAVFVGVGVDVEVDVASLREANAPKPSAPIVIDASDRYMPAEMGPAYPQSYPPSSATPKPRAPTLPNYDLEPLEADAILTFNQTVEQLQAQGGRDLSRYPAVTELYDKANALRPKLAMSLSDTTRKEEVLIDMHEKLSQAVKLYDKLLTEQLSRPAWRAAPAQQQDGPSSAPLPSSRSSRSLRPSSKRRRCSGHFPSDSDFSPSISPASASPESSTNSSANTPLSVLPPNHPSQSSLLYNAASHNPIPSLTMSLAATAPAPALSARSASHSSPAPSSILSSPRAKGTQVRSADYEDWENLKELFARAAERYDADDVQEALPLLRAVIRECHRFLMDHPDPSVVYAHPPHARSQSPGAMTPTDERINGFWTVFILDRCWAIDTPWPMDLAAYQTVGVLSPSLRCALLISTDVQHPFPSDFRTTRTVQSFISGVEGEGNAGHQSILAMHAKAAILYEGATRLASRYNPCKPISASHCDIF